MTSQEALQEIDDEYYHNCLNKATDAKNNKKQFILSGAYRLYELGKPKTDISHYVRRDLKKLGWDAVELDYVSRVLKDEDFTNPNYHAKSYTSLGLENQTEFDEARKSVYDSVDKLSEMQLSPGQLDKLSEAERLEVIKNEKNLNKSLKTVLNDRNNIIDEYCAARNIKLEDKVSQDKPPAGFSGQTELSEMCRIKAEHHKVMSDYWYDIEDQVITFKPSPEVEAQAIAALEEYTEKEELPRFQLELSSWSGIETLLKNATDQKYRETPKNWMHIGVDKYLNYGNHGAGEVNAVLTGEHVMRIGKDQKSVIITPVKREFTREQVGDKTLFEIEGMPDEKRDILAGDLFEQAEKILLGNGLSQFIEHINNNVITEVIKTPEQFFKEKLPRSDIKPEIIFNKPEKIKAVDIDPSSIHKKTYTIKGSKAFRAAKKSEHFSNQA